METFQTSTDRSDPHRDDRTGSGDAHDPDDGLSGRPVESTPVGTDHPERSQVD